MQIKALEQNHEWTEGKRVSLRFSCLRSNAGVATDRKVIAKLNVGKRSKKKAKMGVGSRLYCRTD